MMDKGIVSFDVWKTLVRSNPKYKPERDRLLTRLLNLGDEEVERVSAAVRSADIESDALTDETGVQYGPEERLVSSLGKLSINPSDHNIQKYIEEIQQLFLEYPLIPNEDDLGISLEYMRREYNGLYVLSNTGFIDGAYMRKALIDIGLMQFMEGAFFSNEEGIAKPSVNFFDLVIRKSGVDPCRIVHVGDNIQADYYGALGAGMQALLLSEKGVQGIESAPTIGEAIENGVL